MVGGAVSELLGYVLGLPMVHCWALAVSCSALALLITLVISSVFCARMPAKILDFLCLMLVREVLKLLSSLVPMFPLCLASMVRSLAPASIVRLLIL